MRIHRALVLLCVIAAACAPAAPRTTSPIASTATSTASTPPPATTSYAAHGVDLSAMDRKIAPGDDFFRFANGAWYARAQIPPDREYTGVSLRMAEQAERWTRELLEEAAAAHAPPGSDQQKIGDYYATRLDEDAAEKAGTAPLAPELAKIAAIADKKALAEYLGGSLRADVDVLNATSLDTDRVLGVWVEQDLRDPSRAVAYLIQGGLGMPNRSYYLDESPRAAGLRKQYEAHLAKLFALAGVADGAAKAARAVALETKMARGHATLVDTFDVDKAYNPWPRGDFAKKAPGMEWDTFLRAARLDGQDTLVVWQPTAVVGLAALAKSEPLEAWRDYLSAMAINRAAPLLTRAFVEEDFAFYEKALRGQETIAPRWRRAADATNGALGEAVARAWVAKHFPPETKRAVEAMVRSLLDAFGHRIDALAWMAPETKKKAKEKVAALRVAVGYPEKWRDYSALEIVRGDAFGNADRAQRFEYERNLAKLGKPIDRDEWVMLPHVVNAVNLPVRNALEFPAAILAPPLFDAGAPAAVNYGATGAVIGHEISHSFDDQGSKFDAEGRATDWWTPADLAHFKEQGRALAAQFDAYHPFPDAHVDGRATLGENIADLAGLAAAYDGYRASLGGAEGPAVSGLSGDQQFFLAFAQAWQEKMRDEVYRERLATDGHAPPEYRTDTVRNLDPWYAAFDVPPGAALFLAPDKRVRIW